MSIYSYYYEYFGQEIDIALSELSSSEYRTLNHIFENGKINNAKFKQDRGCAEDSVILKFTRILEKNRKNGIMSFNELTSKIMTLINMGKCNKEICKELNIDYKTLYYELKKVKNFNRDFNRKYNIDGSMVGQDSKNKQNNVLSIGNFNELKILVISDLHFGNSLENIDAVNRAFNYAKGRGINIILCCGDFIDGAFSKVKQIVERYFKQFEHFALDYPYDKNIITFGVGGNHDYSIKFTDDFDFIKFCKKYRDDVVVDNYCNSLLKMGNDSIQMYHEIKGIHKLMSSASVVLNGHRHKFDINYIKNKNYLNIYVPTLSNLIQTVPEALELDLSLENGIIVNVNVKEICFGNRDIILSEKDYNFSNKCNESKLEEQPKIKEMGKRSSQIEKFNRRYGL